MSRRTHFAVAGFALLAGCATLDLNHPLVGHARPVREEAGYTIAVDDGWLVVRMTPGAHPHRFQGSIAAVGAPLGALELDRPQLAEQVAAQRGPGSRGDTIQFDLEPPLGSDEGFRVHLGRACARFDLYFDGAHRAERVHLGPGRVSPQQVPFERCP